MTVSLFPFSTDRFYETWYEHHATKSHPTSLCSYFLVLFYYEYSALGLVWAGTRAQSGDQYGSGTLHPGQVLRGSLPLLSPIKSLKINFLGYAS
jgi:hypothetical protein